MTKYFISEESVKAMSNANAAGDKLLLSHAESYLRKLREVVDCDLAEKVTQKQIDLLSMFAIALNISEDEHMNNYTTLYAGVACADDWCYLNLGNADSLLRA
jgi:hypothetical protein